MKEVYRSFEGKLDLETQNGYIIYEHEKTYEIEFVNIEHDTDRCKIPKTLLSETEFDDVNKIVKLSVEIGNGVYENGQTYYKNKWYSGKTISDIQKNNMDNYWKKYVK